MNSLSENLTLTVLDYNDHRKDHELGVATFDLSKLLDDATQEGLEERILKDGKDRGHLRFDVSFFPVLKPQKVDGKEEELPETSESIISPEWECTDEPSLQRSELYVLFSTRPRISTPASPCRETSTPLRRCISAQINRLFMPQPNLSTRIAQSGKVRPSSCALIDNLALLQLRLLTTVTS